MDLNSAGQGKDRPARYLKRPEIESDSSMTKQPSKRARNPFAISKLPQKPSMDPFANFGKNHVESVNDTSVSTDRKSKPSIFLFRGNASDEDAEDEDCANSEASINDFDDAGCEKENKTQKIEKDLVSAMIVPSIPMDWSVKSKISILSPLTFDWAKTGNVRHTALLTDTIFLV
jgi:hypothetical protein